MLLVFQLFQGNNNCYFEFEGLSNLSFSFYLQGIVD